MYRPFTKHARRYPGAATIDQVPAEEAEDFEYTWANANRYKPGVPEADARLKPGGDNYAYSFYKAFTHAPGIFKAFMAGGRALQKHQGDPAWKSYSVADHELIDLVIGFDSGYWGLHVSHTPNAITAGARIEAIEALADGREEELTDDERQLVSFIRGVRDLTLTDDEWDAMIERLGSRRGAIELAFFVTYLWAHHRMSFALGVAAVDEQEWRQRLQEYKDGTRDPAPETSPYVWESLKRAAG